MNTFDIELDGAEVQSIALTAFANSRHDQLRHCRYWLLKIEHAAPVKEWLGRLLADGLVASARAAHSAVDADARATIRETAAVAVARCGLEALRLQATAAFPFPSAFARGMADPERASLLGDSNRPEWDWGDVAGASAGDDRFRVDLLLVHLRAAPFDDSQGLLNRKAFADHGLSVQRCIETCPAYIDSGTEPFGFRDGLAQPWIPGLHRFVGSAARKDAQAVSDINAVAPGEFILGHENSFGEDAYCPDLDGWEEFLRKRQGRSTSPARTGHARHFARNGSYLAVRQIEQDVAAFRAFDPALAPSEVGQPPTVAERMIGRRRGGAPLVACPMAADGRGGAVNARSARSATAAGVDEAFGFRLDDFEGFICPRGAHIRRANPRDALGWDVESGAELSKLHRLLRRGRVYMNHSACGEPGAAACADAAHRQDCGRGLFFIALNADLDRQFEFVQSRWISNPSFADLSNEADPALGGGSGRAFSMPGAMPIGQRLHHLPQFTTVRGGGYFFLPSLLALEFIAQSATPSHA